MPEFFQTIMGKKFYEGDVPRIAKALETIARKMEDAGLRGLGGEEPNKSIGTWGDDSVQFARLLCEINANVEFTDEQWISILESMDITSARLNELFNRAHQEWEKAKGNI